MVKVLSITQGIGDLEGRTAEDIISYMARISNPSNQMNFDTAPKLLNYCIKNAHWSIFEQASMSVEITTTLAISMQILRHRSFCFQQYSGRYAKLFNYIETMPRRQDEKNRQSSIDDLSSETKSWFLRAQHEIWNYAYELYNLALEKGIAKECARFILPLNSETKLIMTGNIRSWIHYIQLRTEAGTQLEHREIAELIKKEFIKYFPSISVALNWTE